MKFWWTRRKNTWAPLIFHPPSSPSLQLNTHKISFHSTFLSSIFYLFYFTSNQADLRVVYMTIRLPMIHVSEKYIFTLHKLVFPSPFHSRCTHEVIQIERFWVAILDNQNCSKWFWILVLRLLNGYNEFS